jgi:hypothetical protein
LLNKEIHDAYFPPNTIPVIKSCMSWAGHVARMRERTGEYRDFVEGSEVKRPHERHRRR